MLRWVVAPLAALVIVVGAGAINVLGALPMLENDRRKCQAIEQAADQIINQAKAPADSVIFAPGEFLNHLQFVSNYRLYDTSELNPAYILSLRNIDPNEPGALQPARAKGLYDLLKRDRSDEAFKKELPADLAGLMRKLIHDGISNGRRVFVMVPRDAGPPMKFADSVYEQGDHLHLTTQKVADWTEPAIIPGAGQKQANFAGPSRTPPASWQLLEIRVARK
jgi:hypothetical protein